MAVIGELKVLCVFLLLFLVLYDVLKNATYLFFSFVVLKITLPNLVRTKGTSAGLGSVKGPVALGLSVLQCKWKEHLKKRLEIKFI